jgi:hypothetical protein
MSEETLRCDRCLDDLPPEKPYHVLTLAKFVGDDCVTVPRVLRLCSRCYNEEVPSLFSLVP